MAETGKPPADTSWLVTTDPEKIRPLTPPAPAAVPRGRPLTIVFRHRWVCGPISVKCDQVDAYANVDRHGGRVDVSCVSVYANGVEVLGPWHQTTTSAAAGPAT